MRLPTIVTLSLLFSVLSASAVTDFSGRWTLDLQSSSSPDAMLRRLGVSLLQRRLAASTRLRADYQQTPQLLTIETRAPAFARTERLRLDGQPEVQSEPMTGRYTIRNRWSRDGKTLISTSDFQTRDGKPAQLIVTRTLRANGSILNLDQELRVRGENQTWTVNRVWRRG